MLGSAIKQGVGYKECCNGIKGRFVKPSKNANPQAVKKLINTEMKKVQKLSTYFHNDWRSIYNTRFFARIWLSKR